MKFLKHILDYDLIVTGLENIPDNQTMFLPNHFTRFETILLPYVLNQKKGRKVRALASSYMFKGFIRKYFDDIGIVSTKDPERNHKIIESLLAGGEDWVIYPEGGMMKTKHITYKKGKYYLNGLKKESRPVHTGASSMAIKAEIIRLKYKYFQPRNQETELLQEYQYKSISMDSMCIVPVNITYYPMRVRSKDNSIYKFLRKIIAQDLPDHWCNEEESVITRVAEELWFESSLLDSSKIYISFGQAINIHDYVKSQFLPVIKFKKKFTEIDSCFINHYRHKLTTKVMDQVYHNVMINIDHLFILVLYHYPLKIIGDHALKSLIRLATFKIQKETPHVMLDVFLQENVDALICDKDNFEYQDIVRLALQEELLIELPEDPLGSLSINKKKYKIEKDSLNLEGYDFEVVRHFKKMSIILNEVSFMSEVIEIVKDTIITNEDKLEEQLGNALLQEDLDIFKKDYNEYYDQEESLSFAVGKPVLLRPEGLKKAGDKIKIGVLLIHGYKSSPREMSIIAQKIHSAFDLLTYQVRLSGHGTAPRNLADVSWEDWNKSVNRGYAILKAMGCEKVIWVGFSTGGLLAILNAAIKDKVDFLISINSALSVRDISINFVSPVCYWNELIDLFFNEDSKLKKEFVEDEPENPGLNYKKNYIAGINQLKELMDKVNDSLEDVRSNAYIVQSIHDPVVNPDSGMKIYESISSESKEILEIDLHKHTIITQEENEILFAHINTYVENQIKLCEEK